jgi:hypothetical protein
MADSLLTDLNLTTSFSKYLADKLTESGWAVYWQATEVSSGTATFGEVTLVPEFPDDPSLLVLPPKTRTSSEILIPAFTVTLYTEPYETTRAGIGDSEFLYNAAFGIDGFVVDQSQHMAFASMFRNWFKQDFRIPIYDYGSDPISPDLIDTEVLIDRRALDRLRSNDPNIPRPARYFISMQVDFSYYD